MFLQNRDFSKEVFREFSKVLSDTEISQKVWLKSKFFENPN